jgi:hypothetical protein
LQQFSGINIMSSYSSTIVANTGYSTQSTLLASLGFSLIMFVFAFPALCTMDAFGWRNLLLLTFPNMAWCLLAAGLSFSMPADHSVGVLLIAFFIYILTALYGPGIGPMPSIYFSEAFPLSHRKIGGAFTIGIINTVSRAPSLAFPALLAGIPATGVFCFYPGLNVVAFVVVFCITPKTKQVPRAHLSRKYTRQKLTIMAGGEP